MDIVGATRIASWLEQTYIAYLEYLGEGGEPVAYSGNRSGNWDSEGKLRVSKIAKDCPLYSAADNKGLIPQRERTTQDWARFEDAVRVAQVIYEALQWGCESNSFFELETEYRVTQSLAGIVGTIDALLMFHANKGEIVTDHFPVEIKNTKANRWWMAPRGITYDMFLQVVGQMMLLDDVDGRTQFGFLLTRYDTESDPLCKAWTVKYDTVYDGYFLYNEGVCQTAEKDWPVLPDGRIYLATSEYLELIAQHQEYQDAVDPLSMHPPYEFLKNWRCAKVKPAVYYSPNGKNKGQIKEGTGIVVPRCPLFDHCFADKITEAGLSIGQVDYPLSKLQPE